MNLIHSIIFIFFISLLYFNFSVLLVIFIPFKVTLQQIVNKMNQLHPKLLLNSLIYLQNIKYFNFLNHVFL